MSIEQPFSMHATHTHAYCLKMEAAGGGDNFNTQGTLDRQQQSPDSSQMSDGSLKLK